MDASNCRACSSITALKASFLFVLHTLNLSGCLCSRPRTQILLLLASKGCPNNMRCFISSLVARITSISYLCEERRRAKQGMVEQPKSGLSVMFHLMPQVEDTFNLQCTEWVWLLLDSYQTHET
jgi:hypothetical protein